MGVITGVITPIITPIITPDGCNVGCNYTHHYTHRYTHGGVMMCVITPIITPIITPLLCITETKHYTTYRLQRVAGCKLRFNLSISQHTMHRHGVPLMFCITVRRGLFRTVAGATAI